MFFQWRIGSISSLPKTWSFTTPICLILVIIKYCLVHSGGWRILIWIVTIKIFNACKLCKLNTLLKRFNNFWTNNKCVKDVNIYQSCVTHKSIMSPNFHKFFLKSFSKFWLNNSEPWNWSMLFIKLFKKASKKEALGH